MRRAVGARRHRAATRQLARAHDPFPPNATGIIARLTLAQCSGESAPLNSNDARAILAPMAKRYAGCPPAPTRVWDLTGPGSGTVFRAASIADTDAADRDWEKERRSTDTNGWLWSRVLRETDDCVYRLGSNALPVAALFGTRGKHLKLPIGAARRLNFFQVAPQLRGTGFARQAIAVFARFTLQAGAKELVICSLPSEKVLEFYEDIGGAVEDVPGWQPPEGLVPVRIRAATLEELGERADALEEEEVQP